MTQTGINDQDLESYSAFLHDKIFEDVPEGQISVEKPDFKNIAIALRDQNPNSVIRIEQVKMILDFFLSGRKK